MGLRGSHTQVPATGEAGGARGQPLGRPEVQGQLLEGSILYMQMHICICSLLTGFHSDQSGRNRVRLSVLFVFAQCCVSSDPCGRLCAYAYIVYVCVRVPIGNIRSAWLLTEPGNAELQQPCIYWATGCKAPDSYQGALAFLLQDCLLLLEGSGEIFHLHKIRQRFPSET